MAGEWPGKLILWRADPSDRPVLARAEHEPPYGESHSYVSASQLQEVEAERDAYRTGKLPTDHPLIRVEEAEAERDEAHSSAFHWQERTKQTEAKLTEAVEALEWVERLLGGAVKKLREAPLNQEPAAMADEFERALTALSNLKASEEE